MADWMKVVKEKYFTDGLIHDLGNNEQYRKDVAEWYYNKFVKNN